MQNKTKKSYEQPEVRTLGSYIELTQVDMAAQTIDGGPPYCAGNVDILS